MESRISDRARTRPASRVDERMDSCAAMGRLVRPIAKRDTTNVVFALGAGGLHLRGS